MFEVLDRQTDGHNNIEREPEFFGIPSWRRQQMENEITATKKEAIEFEIKWM